MQKLKEDFPISKKIVYMNTAAISLKPLKVINSMTEFMRKCEMNGTYNFSDSIEEEVLENARIRVAELINCKKDDVAFTTNTSEGINFI
ncbi:MAG: aminotransferase class V-fold PLP-dependent enzyme, partial [Nitrososphaeria archaeon]|nr:aminotransferase class V-fold PLP-dependent enzyme [Nitrososphaeria archaeon]